MAVCESGKKNAILHLPKFQSTEILRTTVNNRFEPQSVPKLKRIF